MNHDMPIADVNGPIIPQGPLPDAQAPPEHPIAQPAPGAAQVAPAPNTRQNRRPTGLVTKQTCPAVSGAPPLLELAAAYPMHTQQRRKLNKFVPDASMMFHVLSECDQMMNQADRFTRACPAWIPIVSQLYISVLWLYMILTIQSTSDAPGFSAQTLSQINRLFNIQECIIPGPLVPFFQSLGLTNGPFTWMGDISPFLPSFGSLWNRTGSCLNADYARLIPIPAIILDQLHYFATWTIPNNQTLSANFQWYRNIFSQGLGAHNRLNRIGPQLCGSLYALSPQIEAARVYWNPVFTGGPTRTNAAQPGFTSFLQLFGFLSQTNELQASWFSQVISVMQKYSQFFNGSVPLKSIPTIGNGSAAVCATPCVTPSLRNWIYPANNSIEPFFASRSSPLRAIPTSVNFKFNHSHHGIELEAEQYAILAHTNINWANTAAVQNDWTAINNGNIRSGDYWTLPTSRTSSSLNVINRYTATIGARFHQANPNRVD